MSTHKLIVSFFLFPFAIVLAVASISDNCSYSKCNTMVSYPFRTPDQPDTCGLPSFDLLCDIPNNKPLLSLQSSAHTFSVDSILYSLKEITLSDPQGCLQENLLGFDSSGTPFRFNYSSYFSLYNCSRSNLPGYCQDLEIKCLSGKSYSVVSDKHGTYSLLTYGCELIGHAKGPDTWTSYEFSSAETVGMTWDLPADCQQCTYGECQRDPNDLKGVTCSASPPPPSSATSPNSSEIVLPVVAFPILLALLCLGICCKVRRSMNQTTEAGSSGISTANRQSPVVQSGLEQDALDTYPTIVVGGSGRMLANMEDKTCPVCLSDYEPEESVKTLPECLHRFHANCIDEWLRTKALCPLCRAPPSRR